MVFPMSTLVGLGRGCRLRLSEAWWGLVMLNRTDSLTHRDCGNQDVVTTAELCLNRIESYTTGLLGYKYSTVAVDCNSGVWALLLRAFCPNISCPISVIQPFFASLQSDLEQIRCALNTWLKPRIHTRALVCPMDPAQKEPQKLLRWINWLWHSRIGISGINTRNLGIHRSP